MIPNNASKILLKDLINLDISEEKINDNFILNPLIFEIISQYNNIKSITVEEEDIYIPNI